MKLIDRQIEAVQATLEQVIGEYERKERHSQKDCLLCKEFKHTWGYDRYHMCKKCPLTFLINASLACVEIAQVTFEYSLLGDALLEDIAGFLTSLLISLKEMQ